METILLGGTGIRAGVIGFGALPIQRAAKAEAARVLRRAYDSGINFYDTARSYTDSEEKMGAALGGVRQNVILATKVSGARTGEDVARLLHECLRNLKTDYVDLLQFHNPPFVPRPGGEDGMYDAMLKLRDEGKIRFIGITNHNLTAAEEALSSGLFSSIQYPLSYLSTPEEEAFQASCAKNGVAFLAMKPFAGGLLNDGAAVWSYFSKRRDTCLPLYGFQRMEELEQFLAFAQSPPEEAAAQERIRRDREELKGDFCRGCGYCLPCPAGINLPMACRMSLLLRRAPVKEWTTPFWREQMEKTKDCMECGACNDRCPYHFMPQTRLAFEYEEFTRLYRQSLRPE